MNKFLYPLVCCYYFNIVLILFTMLYYINVGDLFNTKTFYIKVKQTERAHLFASFTRILIGSTFIFETVNEYELFRLEIQYLRITK